jgi:hypothetical protein
VKQKHVEELRLAANAENNGRGISCVRSMLQALDRGDIETARIIFGNEGDKVRQYPRVDVLLRDILGCRMHGENDCEDSLCASLLASAKRASCSRPSDNGA